MATSPESPAEPIKFTGKGPVHYFPATQGIVVGSPVVLKGLVNSDHFNGSQGTVSEIEEFEEGKLYVIEVIGSDGVNTILKAREANLKVGVTVEVFMGNAQKGEELAMKVTCSQEIDLPSFQTALGLALFDPAQPRLEYSVLAVKYDDQQLQSTAPFKWVQAGGEIEMEAEVSVKPAANAKAESACCSLQ